MDRRTLWRQVKRREKSTSLKDLEKLLTAYGWALDRVKGSHHIYRCGPLTLSVPYRRPHVLPIYVRQVLAFTRTQDQDPAGGDDDDDGESGD